MKKTFFIDQWPTPILFRRFDNVFLLKKIFSIKGYTWFLSTSLPSRGLSKWIELFVRLIITVISPSSSLNHQIKCGFDESVTSNDTFFLLRWRVDLRDVDTRLFSFFYRVFSGLLFSTSATGERAAQPSSRDRERRAYQRVPRPGLDAALADWSPPWCRPFSRCRPFPGPAPLEAPLLLSFSRPAFPVSVCARVLLSPGPRNRFRFQWPKPRPPVWKTGGVPTTTSVPCRSSCAIRSRWFTEKQHVFFPLSTPNWFVGSPGCRSIVGATCAVHRLSSFWLVWTDSVRRGTIFFFFVATLRNDRRSEMLAASSEEAAMVGHLHRAKGESSLTSPTGFPCKSRP